MTQVELERTLEILKREVYPEIFEVLHANIQKMYERLIESDLDEPSTVLALCQFASCQAFEKAVALTLSVLSDPSPDGTYPPLFRVK
ncbi:hypothetical protein GCM10025859_51590 [Alicyclobacillus fastidiosus]|nr:hypothetical protein GCM10025859_51590 [Alicyclobacillus fastidiosus]